MPTAKDCRERAHRCVDLARRHQFHPVTFRTSRLTGLGTISCAESRLPREAANGPVDREEPRGVFPRDRHRFTSPSIAPATLTKGTVGPRTNPGFSHGWRETSMRRGRISRTFCFQLTTGRCLKLSMEATLCDGYHSASTASSIRIIPRPLAPPPWPPMGGPLL